MDTGDIIPTSSKHSYDNIIATIDEDKFQKQNVQTIYRVGHTDNFACNNCKMIGDRFFMKVHNNIINKNYITEIKAYYCSILNSN
jgi:hypothetical protein